MKAKRILALLLSVAMVLSMTTFVYADEELPAIAAGTVKAAKIVDQDAVDALVYDAGSYEVTAETGEGVIDVDIAITGLKEHNSIGSGEGYWTGFAVVAPDGANEMKYAFGDSELSEVTPVEENVFGEEDGIAFYVNAGADEPCTSVKLQWYTDDAAVSAVTTFVMDLTDVKLDTDAVVAAKIVDNDDAEAVVYESNEVVATQVDGVINIAVETTGLKAHKNAFDTEGYWTGFAVVAPEDADGVKYAFGTSAELALDGDVEELETAVNGSNDGIAFYANAGEATPKTFAKVQWYNEGGEAISAVTSYVMDLSGVTLAYAEEIVATDVIKAQVSGNYDTFEIAAEADEDGAIVVDIDMTGLEEHENADTELGYWTGFALVAPEDADGVRYAFGNNPETLSMADYGLEANVFEDKAGVAFYANAGEDSPKTYVKVQWLKGVNAISDVATFVMDLSDVGFNWITADAVEAAIIADNAGVVTELYDAESYTVVPIDNEDGTIVVDIAASNLKEHKNAYDEDGYWVGFAVVAPDSATQMKYAFGTNADITLGDLTPETESISFYANAADQNAKTYAKLQWFDAEGKALSAPTTFVMDLADVTIDGLADVDVETVGKANIVDQDDIEKQPYGTYIVIPMQAEDNGVIVVDIAMTGLKKHKNANTDLGYWTGFSVIAPEGADGFKYAFADSIDGLAEMTYNDGLETAVDGTNDGVAFYTDVENATKYARLQWFKEGKAISNVATFEMDLADVAKYRENSPQTNSGVSGIGQYTVTFNTNGGSTIAAAKVKKDATVTEPAAPVKEGFKFDGWYTDAQFTAKYDFAAPVTKSFTLFAKWVEVAEDGEDTKMTFADVTEGDWFFEAVNFVYENGITNGMSETEYAPNGTVTRAQFITMLCRAYGIEEMEGDNFADAGDTWYTGYLAAAKQLGISGGVGDNMFAPERVITREEMVTMLYNYIKTIEDVTIEDAAEFADADEISDWAKDAVAFASSKGYVQGKGDNKFDPKGTATRAELAQIFYNIFK